jgi:hypothetical protein
VYPLSALVMMKEKEKEEKERKREEKIKRKVIKRSFDGGVTKTTKEVSFFILHTRAIYKKVGEKTIY